MGNSYRERNSCPKRNLWGKKIIRIPVLILLLAVSTIYFITTLLWILEGMWESDLHLLSLVWVLVGSISGICLAFYVLGKKRG